MLRGAGLMAVNKHVSKEFRYLIVRVVCIVKTMLMSIKVEVDFVV